MSLLCCPFNEELLNKILYHCVCGVSSPLSRMYFCRHCLEIRCYYCVSHEVDSHYCPNCLENMPSAEARLKKNRCANCFDCPACGHTLSTKATGVVANAANAANASNAANTGSTSSTPGTSSVKRVYYLSCVFCRWTSRDIGLPDQNVASGGWPERENADAARIAVLQEHYRSIAQREKLEKESKRHLGRKLSYLQLSDKYGLARKRAGLPPLGARAASGSTGDEGSDKNVEVSEAEPYEIHEIEDMDTVIQQMKSEIKLSSLPSMDVRLAQVDTQPPLVSGLFPIHKHLMIKRSQRCRKCEHNLSKPEYNPTSIKFKIQLAAYYHVPEVTIFRPGGPWLPGNEGKFMLKISNPTQHATTLEFLTSEEIDEFNRETNANKTEDQPRPIGSLLRVPSLIQASENHSVKTTGTINLPPKKSQVFLPPRDDAAEFDESGPDMKGHVDDKNVVAWRKGNKVGVVLSATPHKENVGDLIVSFGLKFLYTNTVSALEQREIQTAFIVIPIFINLGPLGK